MKGSAERHFEKFKLTGSPRALGAVFDQLAPELLSLAQRLAGDPILAEDLVQLTFITAIERAKSFRSDARLTPWLIGILGRHAKAELRRGARRPDPLRLEFLDPPDPADQAQAAELEGLLEAALSQMPEAQRSVLTLRLRHGLSAPQIAEALGRPAGTVRSQLARGTEHLRRAIPSSLVAGTALAALFPRGLDALRVSLVNQASALAPSSLAVAKGTLLYSLTEVLIMKKIAVAALAVLVAGWGLRAVLAPPDPTLDVVKAVNPNTAKLASQAPEANWLGGTEKPLRASSPEPGQPGRRESTLAAEELNEDSPGLGDLAVQVSGPRGETISSAACLLSQEGDSNAVFGYALRSRTDEEGRSTFTDLAPGDYSLGLLREDSETSVTIRAGETTQATLRVQGGFDLRGLVVDGLGDPVAGAEIWLSERWRPNRGAVVTRTDPAGRFELKSVFADNYVAALAPGYGISYVQPAHSARFPDAEMRIVLDALGGRIAVEVVDRMGQPIPDALVQVGSQSGRSYRRFSDGDSAPPPPPRFQRTDRSGRCELSSIPIGITPVIVRATGYGLGEFEAELFGDQVSKLRVTLQDQAVLTGVITDEAGQPVPGTGITIGRRPTLTSAQCLTDDRGNFELDGLQTGPLELVAYKPEVGLATRTIQLKEGEAKHMDLILRTRETIHGSLSDWRGEPLAGYTLVARNQKSRVSEGSAVTDEAGAFVIGVQEEVPYTVLVRRPGDWRSFPLLVQNDLFANSEFIDLRLPREGVETVSLRLSAAQPGGGPARGARLELWHQELKIWRTYDASSDAATFELNGLPPGTLELTLRHLDYPMLPLGEFTTKAGEQLDLGTRTFSRSGNLVGTLLGLRDPELLDGLEILVSKVGGENGLIQHQAEHFESSALAPGDYLLSISGDFVVPVFRPVTIQAEETTRIDVVLERAGMCRVEVRCQEGAPSPLWVGGKARDASGRVVWSDAAQMLGDERYELRVSAALGSLALEAEDDRGRQASCQVELVSTGVEAPPQTMILLEVP